MPYTFSSKKLSSSQLAAEPTTQLKENTAALRAMSYEEGAQALSPNEKGDPLLIESLPDITSKAGKDVGIATRSNVEERSKKRNTKYDRAFHAMNADYSLGYTIPRTTRDTKDRMNLPVSVGFEGDNSWEQSQAITEETGIENIRQYRDMVIRDFNFMGVVSKFAGNVTGVGARFRAGMDPFIKAVVERFYPGHKVDAPEVQTAVAIAKNIWSYATRGCDMNGTTDVSELQGLLFVFDKEVRASSNSNTKMEKETFTVPGTEDWDQPIELRRGDARHGRATILTTRHLLADMSTTPTDLNGFVESHLLLDKSSSMRTDEYKKLGLLIGRGGLNGKIGLGGFDSDGSSLKMVNDGALMHRGMAKNILREASAGKRDESGDRKHPALTKTSGNPYYEHGLQAALTLLKEMPKKKVPTQVVVVTDEPDYDPSCIGELQKLAKARNVIVKVLYSFDQNAAGTRVHSTEKNRHLNIEKREIDKGAGIMNLGKMSTHYVVVDVSKIENVEKFLTDRNDQKELSRRSDDQKARDVGRYQLDWHKVAMEQGVEVHSW